MTPTPEMVERVARAVSGFNRHGPRAWGFWTDEAHAAIEAVTEPTDLMIAAGDYGISHGFGARLVFRAMLYAALEVES